MRLPQEWLIHASNWGMLISGFIGHVVKSKSLASASPIRRRLREFPLSAAADSRV